MDAIKAFAMDGHGAIECVDMHTAGEPTRIVVKGYPDLNGTLLEQRAQAKSKYDHIRRQLILEPRGHYDMYGALLRSDTEKIRSGEADIGVLFLTNDGYSTMCGHATIALGRFLVDTQDPLVFPNRKNLQYDSSSGNVSLRLHAPCGVLHVCVPTVENGQKSDPSKPVSFTSVECFVTGLNISISLKPENRWAELGTRTSITADFSYGGAFYCLVPAQELGFSKGLTNFDMDAMNVATKRVKAAVNDNPDLKHLFVHPESDDLSFLYSVIVVDGKLGELLGNSRGAETGLCFFSDQEVDRSPTGSGVSARLAVAYARGKLALGKSWTYHSLVSLHKAQQSAFVGTLLDAQKEEGNKFPRVRTQVEGYGYYTGHHTFFVEEADPLGQDGFLMSALSHA
ncbi:hypothetical protein H2198_001814 [Neophaeococcomyces mojaviensis]|uniref:Uncharacterized protein n=1 Tax=Neophaeococcomyces mojaviensis TaxID=3383035 RepID=A0ACC3AGC1_9EURO|nr:hypothetical protein H2198_001814 [Knufia sp. JES_112]